MDIHAHLGPVGAEWAKRVGEPFPAATAIQVTGLALKEALLEILRLLLKYRSNLY